jgi:DNA-binding MarR family transcriptional regulator
LTVDAEPLGPPLIGALLRMPGDAVRARIVTGLHDAGFDDLVPAHFAVMRYPGPQNRRPSDVAREAGMTKQAMNYLLRQLEQLGYLTLESDPDDQRSKRIHLTGRGYAAALNIRRTVRRIEREWERELGAAQYAQLRSLLVDLGGTKLVRQAAHDQVP